jgi:ATP/maltotriose-dependent transcriptional regulator MalT
LLTPPRRGHEFLTRRAHVRAALLHGLFGDRAAARIHQRRATAIVRTGSWAEAQIDVEARLVDALLLIDDDTDAAADEAVSLTYEPMGELWPFFLMVMERAAITAGRPEDGRARLEALRATGLAAAGTTGAGASVFGQELGFDAVLRGNVVQARDELATADPDHWRTHFVAALVALLASNPRRAMRELAAAEPQTRSLRQAEYRRLAVLALAHLADGEEVGPTAAITRVARQLGPFDQAFLTMLSPSLMAHVEKAIPHLRRDPRWARDPRGVLGRPRLSASELNVLAGLNRGLSREEIADSLFVSANTVKSQLASLYRKLGVSSAGAAVREAARLDLL